MLQLRPDPLGGEGRDLSWQDLGSIGEMISAIAVVVSLIYLAFQIRQNTSQIDQNTKAARAAAFDSSITHAMVARQAILENEDVARIYHDGSIAPDSLSEQDRLRYRLIVHNVLWSLWNLQSQAQVGGLAAETWEAQLMILRRMMSSKGVQWFWSNYRQEFGESFQEEVAKILSVEVEPGDHA
ncbi:MAG: hypothetical protein JRH01_03975 [Deltaproteobacteria bacterium]|nr:hypothetical protein [Deltaproteobacteria bacterium]